MHMKSKNTIKTMMEDNFSIRKCIINDKKCFFEQQISILE